MDSRRSSASHGSTASAETFEDALESPSPLSTRFEPDEETKLLAESNATKIDANYQFAHGDYSQAVSTYERALASCPNYLDYEVAVLKSNMAACHIKLAEWKTAVESATQGLAALDRAEGKEGTLNDTSRPHRSTESASAEAADSTSVTAAPVETGEVVELEDDADPEEQLRALQLTDERREQIGKLRTKLLLRRAKGNQEQSGWSNLSAAQTDYTELLQLTNHLPDRDQRFVRSQLAVLPARIKEAQEHEVGEMMGKLKDLGNSFLKPFGLSTDNFNMVKDEKTGGYSMSFNNGNK